MIQLAPAWSRVRRVDGEAAARLEALCALAAAVCSIDATHLRAALASLIAACPGQQTPPRTPVKAPRPLSPLGLGPPETPVTPLSPHAAEPIDDWDDWDDDEVEEPVVASSAGLAVLVDTIRAELGAEASAPRLSFFWYVSVGVLVAGALGFASQIGGGVGARGLFVKLGLAQWARRFLARQTVANVNRALRPARSRGARAYSSTDHTGGDLLYRVSPPRRRLRAPQVALALPPRRRRPSDG